MSPSALLPSEGTIRPLNPRMQLSLYHGAKGSSNLEVTVMF